MTTKIIELGAILLVGKVAVLLLAMIGAIPSLSAYALLKKNNTCDMSKTIQVYDTECEPCTYNGQPVCI